MKIDIEKLRAAAERAKNPSVNKLPAHEAWVPQPDKEEAKSLGVRWNSEAQRHEFYSDDPDNHPCSKYQPKNFIRLCGQIKYALHKEFKSLGVVTVKENDEWHNYVMMHDDYAPLISTLVELELIVL